MKKQKLKEFLREYKEALIEMGEHLYPSAVNH